MTTSAAVLEGTTDARGRPTAALPFAHLVRISAYWLGLTAIDAGVSLIVENRIVYGSLVSPLEVGRASALVGLGGAIIGIIIQPTVGAISDYTVSRWGRRKPYIVIGSVLDVFFLLGIAYSNSLLAIAAFVMLLAFSTNIARGPFQGYVPDLVPKKQVGLASAMVGLMQILGNVIGYGLASVAASATFAERTAAAAAGRPAADYLPLALIAIAVIELVTMVSVVRNVREGRPPQPREGKSWLQIAQGAWATDILKERSYIYLVASRLFFLMGGSILVNKALVYLSFTHGLDQGAANGVLIAMLAIIVVGNLVAMVPAARISDRIGRKPVIYAACAIGAVGILIAALAPSIEFALVGGGLFGVSAGTFLAVDWALMTDIIPKAEAGRYMGLSNVATGAATPLSLVVAGVTIDLVNTAAGSLDLGPRIAYLIGVLLYGIAVLLFRPVVEPPRAAREAPA